MEYILNQYDYDGQSEKSWVNPITNASLVLLKGSGELENVSKRVAIRYDSNFTQNHTYYCMCYIYNDSNIKEIKIKLKSSESENEQYITTININPRASKLIDFVFTPQDTIFDHIVFDVVFSSASGNVNYSFIPQITALELSEVLNLQSIDVLNAGPYRKIGVQSTPNVRMIINNEEIKIGRTGIYELKNPDVKIEFFGMVEKAQKWGEDDIDIIINKIKDNKNPYQNGIEIDETYNYLSQVNAERVFSSFTLDYIYEQE